MATHDLAASDRSVAEIVGGGALSGVIAGLIMAMVAMVHAGALGLGFWLPVKEIAAVVYGVEALIGGVGVVVVGLVVHLGISAAFGMLYALVIGRRATMVTSLVAGLIYGAALWAFMTWLVLPWANEVMFERTRLIPVMWFVDHLAFGAGLTIAPAVEQAAHVAAMRRRTHA